VAGLLAGVTPVQLPHTGDGITVYWLMAAPLVAGAVQLTVMLPLLFTTAVTAVGAAGGSAAVTGLDAADTGPDPMPLSAWTVNVYGVPRGMSKARALGRVDESTLHPEHAGDSVTK
jgi:hypothetical protein